MKERPILFSKPMVLALLAGTKTQTRRVVKPQPAGKFIGLLERPIRSMQEAPVLRAWFGAGPGEGTSVEVTCPQGKTGDQLWVREAWRADSDFDGMPPRDLGEGAHVWYEAGAGLSGLRGLSRQGKLRPSMFMPRWASRITLEVTGVRVERLQDISEVDARAEGCRCNEDTLAETGFATYRDAYKALWETINGDTSWDLNPWVWAIEFRRLA